MEPRIKDSWLLIALLAISFVSVYFMPMLINRIIFILILVAAWHTKFDYVFFVWFFIINDAPGRLFSVGTFEGLRIPLYPITPGISLGFSELFILLCIIKFIYYKRASIFVFKKEFTYFYMVGVFIFLVSLIIGIGFDNYVRVFRLLLPWSLIFIIPAYIKNKETMIRATRLLFPVVILALASQIHTYITGNYLDSYLRTEEVNYMEKDTKSPLSRSISAVYIILFSTIMAFYFLYDKLNKINKNYLAVIVFIAAFSIFLSATRGWIFAYIVLIASVLIYYRTGKEFIKIFRIVFVSLILFVVLLTQFPFLRTQMQASYQRFLTLEQIVEGDVTAGGTLKRIDERSPRVMKKFRENPLIGWGFSDDYFDYADGHVGHQNILLNVGVIGYVYLNLLFLHFCVKIWMFGKANKAIRIFVIGLIAIYLIHGSSTQFWGYAMYFNQLTKIIFFAFLFTAINVFALKDRFNTINNT